MSILLRTRTLVRSSGALRAGALRRMCTAVEEAAPPSPFSPSGPHNAAFYGALFLSYCFALRWQSKDRALAKEIAAAKEAKAAELAAAAPAVEEPVAVAASPPAATTSAVVKAISAVPSAPAGASPTTWKVADVSVWLESIELPMHVEAFKEHSVNGKMLLALTDQDLYQTLGIQSPLHRKKLLMEISAARKAYLNP